MIKEKKANENNSTIYYVQNEKIVTDFFGNEQEAIIGKKMITEEKVITSINSVEPGFI